MNPLQRTDAARTAEKMLLVDYSLAFEQTVLPRPGLLQNNVPVVLNDYNHLGFSHVKLLSMTFTRKDGNKDVGSQRISIYYATYDDSFFVIGSAGRIYTKKDGQQVFILNETYGSTKNGRKDDEGNYYVGNFKDNEIITPEMWKKLPYAENDGIMTNARACILELAREYMFKCGYRLDAKTIKDSRKTEDSQKDKIIVELFDDTRREDVAKQVNDFITSKREYYSDRSPRTQEDLAMEQQNDPKDVDVLKV